MMFSITILTCNRKNIMGSHDDIFAKVGKISWVPMMLCQRWYNITGGFSKCDTGTVVIKIVKGSRLHKTMSGYLEICNIFVSHQHEDAAYTHCEMTFTNDNSGKA